MSTRRSTSSIELSAVGRDPWRDDVYAHEYFGDDQCYDGILVSRAALEQNGTKRDAVNRIGLRGYLRLPRRFELMGDCGAFGYVNEPKPIYETPEVLDFYQRVGVDYGVSIDHIIFPAFPEQRDYRYNLTIDNGIEFLERHRAGDYAFTPVGAVQGWDVASYAEAAKRLAIAGYDMLAVGGLVRSRTAEILAIAKGVAATVGTEVRLHLLGVARDEIIPDLAQLGVFSFDSASPMRTAWMSADQELPRRGDPLHGHPDSAHEARDAGRSRRQHPQSQRLHDDIREEARTREDRPRRSAVICEA